MPGSLTFFGQQMHPRKQHGIRGLESSSLKFVYNPFSRSCTVDDFFHPHHLIPAAMTHGDTQPTEEPRGLSMVAYAIAKLGENKELQNFNSSR
jgi:hypothetical protein